MTRILKLCLGVACLGLALNLGCSTPPATNPELASVLDVLKSGLEAWKNGVTPTSLKAGEKPVQFSDNDWQAGAKLLEYRILKLGAEEEGETVCTVFLKVELRGKAVERNLDYRVKMTPTCTVSRYSKA